MLARRLTGPAAADLASWLPGRWGSALGGAGVASLLAYPHPVAWLGLAVLLLLGVLRWRRTGRLWPASPFTLPLGLYLAGAVVGLVATLRPDTAAVRMAGLVAALGAVALVLDQVDSPRAAQRLVYVVLAATALAAPLLLVLTAPELRLDRLPGPTSAVAELIAAAVRPLEPLRAVVLVLDDVGQRFRISPAGLGALAAFGMGLALGPLVAGSTRRARLLGGAALGYFGVFLLLPANRTALLTAALVPLVLLAARYRWARIGLLGAALPGILLLGGLLPAPPAALFGRVGRLLPDPATDLGPLYERLVFWQNYLYLLQDSPLTGVGLGLRSAAKVYRRHFLPVDPGYNHAHNILLQSYLEQGILGAVGLLAFVVVGLAVGARALRRSRSPAARSATLSAGAAAIALLLGGLTEIVPVTTFGMVLTFGSFALWYAAGRLEQAPPDDGPARPAELGGRPGLWGAALLVAATLLALAAPALASWRGADRSPAASVGADRPLLAAAGRAYLNLGAVELEKALQGDRTEESDRERHLTAAERLLAQSRSLSPGDPAVSLALAELAIARADEAAARELLARASKQAAPDDSLFFFQAGRLYREMDSVDRAISSWLQVDRAMGGWSCSSTDLQLLLWGADLLDDERYGAAARALRASIQLTPTRPEPYRLLTLARLAGRDDPRAALNEMEDLVRTQPAAPWPYLELAGLQERAGRLAEARTWQQRATAVESSPAWAELRQRLGPVRACGEFLPTTESDAR